MADDAQTRINAIMANAITEITAVIASESEGQAVCTNWVLLAEWSPLGGDHWITRNFDETKPLWQRFGMLHQALYGDWEPRE